MTQGNKVFLLLAVIVTALGLTLKDYIDHGEPLGIILTGSLTFVYLVIFLIDYYKNGK